MKVCAGSTISTIMGLNQVTWHSRSDTTLAGVRGQQIEVRYQVPASALVNGQRITQGTSCGIFFVRGYVRGESQTVRCPSAPITIQSTDFITLQAIDSRLTFLMVGEVVIS